MTSQPLVDFDLLTADIESQAAQYATAAPFPHIVIDDVLTEDAFAGCVREFPGTRDPFWKGYLHVNETKYANTQPDTWGDTLTSVARELVSPRFVGWLEQLTGIPALLPDWTMDGGGLHQTLRGGHLNVHADFSTHHVHEKWARRVNILLYLNDEWRDEWGGHLELWDKDMSSVQGRVTPKGNRMLVFTTSQDSYHGHPDPLLCPDNVARRSMALYYFTEEERAVRRSTDYRARPQDGAKRVAIWADKNVVDLYDRAKRRLRLDDDTAQRILARIDGVRRRK